MDGPPFHYCLRCGAEGLERVTHMELLCRGCGYRQFLNPAPAVVAILRDAAGRLLLIERARDPGRGQLALPGGFVEPGETAEEALRRELREEVAMEPESLQFMISLPNRYHFQGWNSPVLDLFFTGTLASFDGARAQPGEIASVQVVEAGAVPYERIAFESNAQALRHYERTLADR